jgi:predicted Zn-dependent peptidase
MHGERVGYCGVVVNAGSREDGLHPGIAHFVEHTLFKGTLRRTSSSISNLMESLGGELNAYTSK